jgi:hypothetical protein
MVRSSFAYGAFMIAMFAVMTVFYLHFRPRCSDEIVSEQKSPDGQWVAAILEGRCGEDQPFFTHVNLRAVNDSIDRGYFSGRARSQGEVFLLEQDAHSANVTLHWITPKHLSIACTHCQLAFLREHMEQWGDVKVTYALGE